jgi:transposase-like protein
MITETVTYRCRHCSSERLRKNGHADNGAQRVQCLECGKTLVLAPKGPRYTPKDKERVLRASLERASMRAITRTLGPCYQTQKRWLREKNQGIARRRRHASARTKRRPTGGG